MDFQHLAKRIREPDGEIIFAERVLGLPVSRHPGQMNWLINSKKRINILRPGNKFGKSLIGAVRHIFHGFTKINMDGMYSSIEEWQRLKYDTLNFGPGYEQAREILRMVRDICQGEVFLPVEFQKEWGVTNKSLLKDWFITEDRSDANMLPSISFWSGVNLLGRSYSDMGGAFKMKGIAYLSGDEVADIAELWTFTNGTLLPRGVAYKNFQIDYYGTPQAEGHDYMRMIDMAEEDMQHPNWAIEGMFYVQKGTMFENPFLDKDTVESLNKIQDPILKRQVLYGEYVETGEKYYGFERVQNAVDKNLTYTPYGYPGRKYLVIVDFAGGESSWADYTVIGVIDYTDDRYRLVHFRRFKGGDVPIPLQYKLVEEIFNDFKEGKEGKALSTKLLIDSSALGGKNALAFLKQLNPIQFEATGSLKAEMLATLKIALDGGQVEKYKRKSRMELGEIIDENPDWGIIRIPNEPVLISELQNYKLDDKKIRTDCVMMLGMGVHYLEMRRPKNPKTRIMDFDLSQLI